MKSCLLVREEDQVSSSFEFPPFSYVVNLQNTQRHASRGPEKAPARSADSHTLGRRLPLWSIRPIIIVSSSEADSARYLLLGLLGGGLLGGDLLGGGLLGDGLLGGGGLHGKERQPVCNVVSIVAGKWQGHFFCAKPRLLPR
jgi:hypothetical protein